MILNLVVIPALIISVPADGFLGVMLMPHEDTGKPVVTMIVKDSPAEKAGIRIDDIIEKLDGQAVLSVQDLIEKVKATKPGTEVTFSIRRGKESREIKVKLGTRPDDLARE